jgi:hypothetical protein
MLIALIVSLIAIAASVLLGILGYLIDKTADPAEPKVKGKGA